ncbi:LURP-one-related family protein [Streptomyces sp. NPDC051940]|uniref:LURP-one-related/scramblase family protein n=1 Tax=Streptomyces sp. NPDC051940 TaxID=3155675 RepID=UPI00342A5606
MKYLVREKYLDIGDDSWIEDENGDRAFYLDGKVLRVRDTFQLKDASGQVLLTVKQKLVALRPSMTLERDGETVCTISKKRLKLLRERYWAELATGEKLDVYGNIIDKEFDIEYEGERLARVSRKWFRLRDTYAVDIEREDADAAMLLGVAIAVDRLEARLMAKAADG